MAIQAPASILIPALRNGSRARRVGEPRNDLNDEKGGWSMTQDHIGEVNPQLLKVIDQPPSVGVNQACEAEASPNCTPLL